MAASCSQLLSSCCSSGRRSEVQSRCCGMAGEEKEILVEHDDGIRPDISTAALSKLKPVFKKDGSTTAGNSSQVLHCIP